MPLQVHSDGWDTEDASYVGAGGLGDLGLRLLSLMASSRSEASGDTFTPQSSIQNAAASLSRMKVPPVGAVIQPAVILRDRMLDSMTYDDFQLVTRIKVEGTLALEHVFTGGANYNAGNAVQDAISQAHRGASCHFMSLNIGWIEDAVSTADHEVRLSSLRRTGLRPIKPDELSRYLKYVLEATAHNGNIHSPMFCHIKNAASTADTSSSAPVSQTFKEVVAGGSSDSIIDFITSVIAEKLSRLIFIDGIRINERHGSILEADQTVRALAEKVTARAVVMMALDDTDKYKIPSPIMTPPKFSTSNEDLPLWGS
ncbi:hypothetical protein F4804DRAFT_334664 [Jackrogersella minutella]|nr:hypothetical protein F4804DRAFT_334664 [Jackrogersella minutella]